MRKIQPEGKRGSLKWIQRLVENQPNALDKQLRRLGALSANASLNWRSPLRSDGFAEYRDAAFLDRIDCRHLEAELKAYWPARGPQWDGLAVDGTGRVYLFEAKAHSAEMASTCQAGAASRKRIAAACESAKKMLGAKANADWLTDYYQYANRIAHLAFLRQHGVEAWLVFLYFTGDEDMGGPASKSEWQCHIDKAHTHVGLPESSRWIVSVFHDTSDL